MKRRAFLVRSVGAGIALLTNAGCVSEHTGTWHFAYGIPGIRNWIMQQPL